MTKSQLKKIIEQELIKEFGNIGGRAFNLGATRDKDEDDVPDYTKLKKYQEQEELEEVYSDQQRDWACAQAGDDFKGERKLTKTQAKEMCTGPTLKKGSKK